MFDACYGCAILYTWKAIKPTNKENTPMTKQINKAQKTAINQAFAQCVPFTILPVFEWVHKKTPTTYNV